MRTQKYNIKVTFTKYTPRGIYGNLWRILPPKHSDFLQFIESSCGYQKLTPLIPYTCLTRIHIDVIRCIYFLTEQI